MLRAEGSIVIAAEPQEILEFVLDLDRYRLADPKIGAVKQAAVLDEQGRGQTRYRGRLRGLTTPVDTQEIELTRWSKLRFRGSPGVWTRRLTDFEGGFDCKAVEGGTLVTHTETFWFKPAPVAWLAEAYLGKWMRSEMPKEMDLMKHFVEAETNAATKVGKEA